MAQERNIVKRRFSSFGGCSIVRATNGRTPVARRTLLFPFTGPNTL